MDFFFAICGTSHDSLMAKLTMAPGLKMVILIWATNVQSIILLSQNAHLSQESAGLLKHWQKIIIIHYTMYAFHS